MVKVVAGLAVVGMAGVREKCTKRHAQSAAKNAKSLLSLAETVQYTAKNAFRSAGTAAVKERLCVSINPVEIMRYAAFSPKNPAWFLTFV